MSVIKLKATYAFIVIFILSGMMSCTKPSRMNDENAEMSAIKEDDVTESNEDLLNVDYRQFYDELEPYGEWIEVTDKDIGLDMKKESSSGENQGRTISFSDLFGVKDAYARDAAFEAFFIWRPSPNLAVSIVAGEPEPYYVPYANGQWVYTDAGWYYSAPTPHEEIVHHYGRWAFSPAMGWVWVPGRVWAPAWVDWRVSAGYVGWAPVPPCIYIQNNVIYSPPIYEERYIVVENRYFCEPVIYKYRVHGHKIKIREMTRIDGITVINKKIYNHGPDITVIERDRGSKIDIVKVNRVKNIKDAKHTNSEINSYSPDFKKIKNNGSGKHGTFKPGKYESFSDAENKSGKNDKNIAGDNKNRGRNDNFNGKGNDKNQQDKHIDKLKNYNKQKNKNDGSRNNKNKEVRKNKEKGNDKNNNEKNITKGKDNNNVKKFSKKNKTSSKDKGRYNKPSNNNKPDKNTDKSSGKKKNSNNDVNKNKPGDNNKDKNKQGNNDSKRKGRNK